jgi:hypothetical protein
MFAEESLFLRGAAFRDACSPLGAGVLLLSSADGSSGAAGVAEVAEACAPARADGFDGSDGSGNENIPSPRGGSSSNAIASLPLDDEAAGNVTDFLHFGQCTSSPARSAEPVNFCPQYGHRTFMNNLLGQVRQQGSGRKTLCISPHLFNSDTAKKSRQAKNWLGRPIFNSPVVIGSAGLQSIGGGYLGCLFSRAAGYYSL